MSRARFGSHTVAIWAIALCLQVLPAVAAEPAGSVPQSRPAPVTVRDVTAQLETENRRTLVDTFKQIGHKKGAALDARAIDYLEKMARYFAAEGADPISFGTDTPAIQDMLPLGQGLITAGCDDPLVLFCHGEMLLDSESSEAALPHLRNAFAGFQQGKYPDLWASRAADDLSRATDNMREYSTASALARRYLGQACKGNLNYANRRLVYDLFERQTHGFTKNTIVLAAVRGSDADQWVAKTAGGQAHIKSAWKARQGDLANAVTEDRWKVFFDELGKARDDLTAAWKIDPSLPQAPAGMIAVAMGGGDRIGEKTEDWFQRTQGAQSDYKTAYNQMGTALLPRWGGSAEQMLRLADSCFDQPNYNSVQPWLSIDVLRRLGMDSGDRWAMLRSPPLVEKLGKMLDGYTASFGPGKNAFFRSARAALAWRLNDLRESRRILDGITGDGLRPDPKGFESMGAPSGDEMIGLVYAATGPNMAGYLDARTLAQKGDKAGALNELRRIRTNLAPADREIPYLDSLISQTDAAVKFAAGDWCPMFQTRSLRDWTPAEGEWTLDAHNRAIVSCEGDCRSLVWHSKELGMDTGGNFEASVHVSRRNFRTYPIGGGGFTLFNRANGRRGFIEMNLPEKKAIFYFPRPLNATVPADWEADGSELLIHCRDYVLTALIDGKPVGNPVTLPDDFRSGLAVGLGTAIESPSDVMFENPRIRKLQAPEKP